ncbi:MAG: cupin domain-containing protein [Elusimicrobia bacterium]|nr:cupin domain-containing protein [Elusimicrobiota bacterium]
MSESESGVLEDLVGKPELLSGLVAYQSGSIVSRRVIHRETGNITLFAFDQGQELTEHTSPFNALIYVVDGDAEISISRKPLSVKTGEIILLPANVPHAVKAVRPFKMLLMMIRS